jgi:hypothetical protein
MYLSDPVSFQFDPVVAKDRVRAVVKNAVTSLVAGWTVARQHFDRSTIFPSYLNHK